jgi:hypothetical protein
MKQSHIETRIASLEQALRPAQNEVVEIHVIGAGPDADGAPADDGPSIVFHIPVLLGAGGGKITKPGK